MRNWSVQRIKLIFFLVLVYVLFNKRAGVFHRGFKTARWSRMVLDPMTTLQIDHPDSRPSPKLTRGSKTGFAEIVSILSSRTSPSFWASHSGQTALGSARILFLKWPRSKASLQCENQYGVYECDRDLAWVWNCLQATDYAYSIKNLHESFLSRRVEKGSAGRVKHDMQVYSKASKTFHK